MRDVANYATCASERSKAIDRYALAGTPSFVREARKKITQYSESFYNIPTPPDLKSHFLAKLNLNVSANNPILLNVTVLPRVRKHGGIVCRDKINQLVSNRVI